jgi:hypothetical protein
MSRYRKPRKPIDLSQFEPDSKEYWEAVLKREGLSMSRGLYPTRVSLGWEYRDNDPRNSEENTPAAAVHHPLAPGDPKPESDAGPQSKQLSDTHGVAEDSYDENSKP